MSKGECLIECVREVGGKEVERKCLFRPHEAQWPFHLGRHDWKYRLLSAGTGSGKTIAGVAEDVWWCLNYPGIVGYIFEPVYKMIDRIIIPTLNLFFGSPFYESPYIASFTRQRMLIRWYNGSSLWLGSLDEPEQAEGANVDFIHVDEARLVKPDSKWEMAWRVIQRRLRGSGRGYPVGAWVTTTPNWPGTALHRFFEHPKYKNPDARVFRMHIDDNVENLGKDFIENMKRQHSGALYERFIEGKFAGEETATFDFDYVAHVDGFVKPEYGYISFGVDFGWTSPFVIIAVFFDNDGRAFVVDEFYQVRLSNIEIVNKCLEMQEKWGEGAFHCDPSSPDTIDTIRRSGMKTKLGNRNVEDGIMEIGGRFKDAGDGRRRLYVSSKCVNLIEELQIFNPEQKGIWHGTDCLRYCLLGNRRKKEAAWGLGSRLRW